MYNINNEFCSCCFNGISVIVLWFMFNLKDFAVNCILMYVGNFKKSRTFCLYLDCIIYYC